MDLCFGEKAIPEIDAGHPHEGLGITRRAGRNKAGGEKQGRGTEKHARERKTHAGHERRGLGVKHTPEASN